MVEVTTAISHQARRAARERPRAQPDRALAAIATARDLAWSGQHVPAIDAVTAALPARGSDEKTRLGLLELRAESLCALAAAGAAPDRGYDGQRDAG